MTRSDIFFLLGGYDLEMVEIRRLLESCNLQEGRDFADLRLGWGAKLSAYAAVLEDPQFSNRVFAGIELGEDITPPDGYLRIDHHNELSHLPAAIVQVAELLGVDLTPRQLLVAANDARWIPGMQDLGAGIEEISSLRKEDRRAQGVTEEDDEKAKEKITTAVAKSGIKIVEAGSIPFSAVVDLLFPFDRLIVIGDRGLTFYGRGVNNLSREFAGCIANGTAYHGGGDSGFMGFSESNREKLVLIIEKISEVMDIEKSQFERAYSTHIFHFAFRWEANLEPNCSLDRLHELMANITDLMKIGEGWRWQRHPVTFQEDQEFNEFVYYHSFARDVVFDMSMVDGSMATDGCVAVYQLVPDSCADAIALKYEFTWHHGKYSLPVRGVYLRMYDTGVGLLSFHLLNIDHKTVDDVLRINEYGRWLYSGTMSRGVANKSLTHYGMELLPISSLAVKQSDSNGDAGQSNTSIVSDEQKSKHVSTKMAEVNSRIPLIRTYGLARLPEFIKILLGGEHIQFLTGFDFDEKKKLAATLNIAPLIDGKMFVVSWMEDEELATDIRNGDYLCSDKENIYRAIFVDAGKATCRDKTLFQLEMERHAYPRWSGYGSLYGITAYSLVCINSAENPFKFTRHNTNHMYNRMVEHVLVQRATVLKYQHDIATIANDMKENVEEILGNIEDLNRKYLRFLSKYHFKEVTAQIQGQEMYQMLYHHMRLDVQIAELAHEIDVLHQFASSREDKKQSRLQQTMAYVAAGFLIPSFLTGFFGMNVFGNSEAFHLNKLVYGGLVAYLIFAAIIVFYHFAEPKTILKRKPFVVIGLAFLALIVILLPWISTLF